MMPASSSDNASGQLLARLLARRLTRPAAAPAPPALPRMLDAKLPLAYSEQNPEAKKEMSGIHPRQLRASFFGRTESDQLIDAKLLVVVENFLAG
ncbi:MAG: hypothetical protein ABIK82_06940 [Pseudomonadota bacterium]